ncbi:MAG TPA: FAD-dependent oxidoreductase [Solirubrobacteraceae bacterium]|nr:FAD-dependent oxidoreductase [Solirubrobacteraceae bacterium]
MHADVAVIGAGIVGLAVAFETARDGVSVVCLDPAPGRLQSTGPGRIFRLTHDLAEAVVRARAAEVAWRRWEADLGRTLIDRGGCVVLGEDARAHAAALEAAGAEVRFARDGAALSLAAPLRPAGAPALLDAHGGVIDATGAVRLLAARVRPRARLVAGVERDGDVVRLHTAQREVVTADQLVIAAGTETRALAATLGLELPPAQRCRQVRLALRPAGALRTLACCFLDRRRSLPSGWSFYGLPLGDGIVAVGGDSTEAPFDAARCDPDESRRESERQVRDWLALHGEGAEFVGRVECVQAPVDVPGGAPYAITRAGPVVAVRGNNLFKFAPLIGADVRAELQTRLTATA